MSDKRQMPRHPFGIVQQIAPILGGKMPSRDAFRPARCADLCLAGFAFYSETTPDFGELVVALGVSSAPIYLTASVIYIKPVETGEQPLYRIGCRFTGRAQWSEQTQSFLRKGDIESAFLLMLQED